MTVPAGAVLRAMADLPFCTLADLTQGSPTLILAPHADDESLGCGGLIRALCRAGQPPIVVVLTDGAGSHPGSRTHPPVRLAAVREQEARRAVSLLGLPPDRIRFARHRDTAAPTAGPEFEQAVDVLSALCRIEAVATLFAPWQHDPHCDHEAAHLLACQVARRLGLRHLAYPVWGWTLSDDTPLPEVPSGVRLDTSGDMTAKKQAILAHRSQYAGLVADDPAGFVLPENLLRIFDRPFETFLRVN